MGQPLCKKVCQSHKTDPEFHLQVYLPWEMKQIFTKDLDKSVQSTFSHNSQKLKHLECPSIGK